MASKDNQRKRAEKGAHSKKLTESLLWVAAISAFGSVQYGYNLWVVYSPSVLIQDFYDMEPARINESPDKMIMVAVSVSMFAIGGIVGSLLMGPMVDNLGRKGALQVNSFFSMVACLFMACATTAHSFTFTMFSRFLIGITIGIFSGVVPIYLGEISPVNSRGLIGMVPQLFLSLGVLLAQVLALREVMGTPEGWSIIMSLSGILALFQVIIIPSFPESPRYLLIQRNNEEKARKALKALRGREDIEAEIQELRQEDLFEYDQEKDMNALKILCYPHLRWQVLSTIILMSSQQLSGVNAVYYHTERIYQATDIGKDNVRYVSLGSTFLIFVSVLIGMHVVDLKGRKILLLIGFGVSSVLCVVLTITIELQKNASLAIVNSFLINIFLTGHAVGPSSLPVLLISELFLQSSRSSAYVVGGFMHWVLHFFTVITYLQLQPNIRAYSFLVCFPICVAAFFYIYALIPETRGLTFLEIRTMRYGRKRGTVRCDASPTEPVNSPG